MEDIAGRYHSLDLQTAADQERAGFANLGGANVGAGGNQRDNRGQGEAAHGAAFFGASIRNFLGGNRFGAHGMLSPTLSRRLTANARRQRLDIRCSLWGWKTS